MFKGQGSTQKILCNKNFHRTSSAFSIDGADVTFGNFKALSSVSITVERGEFLFITGASGAGKTTLLRLIAGDITPSSGKATTPSDTGLFASKIFQELRLVGRQSCETNILTSYDPNIYRSRNEFYADMNELASVLGIKDRLHLKIKDANGGLKQKVAIIRALLAKPDIILADEPTSSLDYGNSKRLFDVLSLYQQRMGLTILWASHNKELVTKFSGRMAHLENGKLIHMGHACFI